MFNYTFSLVDFEYFLLVLVRVASFVFAAPFFSIPNVPRRTQIGFAAFLAILVTTVLKPQESTEYVSVIGYAILVLKETMTGVLIGYVANLCNSIVQFAGNIIDMDIGLSMATEFDPAMGSQITLTGQMYFYFLNLMLIVTGMYQYVLRAIVDSFKLIPLGGAVIRTDAMVLSMISYMTNLFVISFLIILPVFCCIMILNVVLGIMAKVAPQMNMFTVGVQLKILVGFTVLMLCTFLFPHVCDFVFQQMKESIVNIVGGMTP